MNLTNGKQFIKIFPFNLFSVNTFLMKAIINLSKFCLSMFQISSDFSAVKVLHYTVLAEKLVI